MGGFAISHDIEGNKVYIRQTMAKALARGGLVPSYVLVKPVELSSDGPKSREVKFNSSRILAEAYCEFGYSVGISLSMFGSNGIVRGPHGYQSVRIQLMDRGNPQEIWVSRAVHEAVGELGSGEQITLFPKGS
jgi:hypothetical protein